MILTHSASRQSGPIVSRGRRVLRNGIAMSLLLVVPVGASAQSRVEPKDGEFEKCIGGGPNENGYIATVTKIHEELKRQGIHKVTQDGRSWKCTPEQFKQQGNPNYCRCALFKKIDK